METTSHASDGTLLRQVLRPYKPHCKYLKSANVTSGEALPSARCEFAIPESCYIDDTGHLNAVEVNICYNQMLYYTIAASVQYGLMEEFRGWTMSDYWKHQLPDILIARFASKFRSPVNPRRFEGEIDFLSVQRRSPGGGPPMLVANTAYRYWDAEGGRCNGEVTITVLNLPD
ncbi:(2E)-enoyl-ACP glycyltransferase [Saccharopolyspora shandongensis]|uniref:(2E)-enoyl-ACP glycyltransferase n=1 Tax=Saccharopolyspora shandongensis TaxID=418495 RepID=UPI0033D8F768